MARKKKSEQGIKKFKITFVIPDVTTKITMEVHELNKSDAEERFTRLFKDNKIIKIEEIK